MAALLIGLAIWMVRNEPAGTKLIVIGLAALAVAYLSGFFGPGMM
jgi:hypothetical protein